MSDNIHSLFATNNAQFPPSYRGFYCIIILTESEEGQSQPLLNEASVTGYELNTS